MGVRRIKTLAARGLALASMHMCCMTQPKLHYSFLPISGERRYQIGPERFP